MQPLSSPELWSIIASIVSVILGFLAIAMSVYFFVVGRKTEREVSNSLTKIESQADMLHKITAKQMDRLTRYVTEERPPAEDTKAVTLMITLLELAKPLTAQFQQGHAVGTQQQLRREVITCYIGLYYYTALTNYWSQWYLPTVEEYDEKNEFHLLVRRAVDQSATDFNLMESLLAKLDSAEIEANPVAHLFHEAQNLWRGMVKASADVFVARGKMPDRK